MQLGLWVHQLEGGSLHHKCQRTGVVQGGHARLRALVVRKGIRCCVDEHWQVGLGERVCLHVKGQDRYLNL